jgi:subtilisin-like proprotein convertase family protein
MRTRQIGKIFFIAASIILGLSSNALYASTKTFTATDTPLPVPPADSSGATTSNIVVGESCLIEDLNISVDISHTYAGDLILSVGDSGSSIVLSDRNGGPANNYSITTFDDEAGALIEFGTPPFDGAFKPEHPLSSFDGSDALGTWTLTINDAAVGDSGTLHSWSIIAECQDQGPVQAQTLDQGGTSHYLSYKIKTEPKFQKIDVLLTDQHQSGVFTLDKRETLLVPADKNGEGIADATTHLLGYKFKSSKSGKSGKSGKSQTSHSALVENQFGSLYLDVKKAEMLLVPASKSLTDPTVPAPDNAAHQVNHLLCYKVKPSEGASFEPILGVSLVDQFETKLYDVVKPKRLCGPVDKNGEGVKISEEPEDHLLCYEARHARFFVNDQFGPAELNMETKRELCVPSVATF